MQLNVAIIGLGYWGVKLLTHFNQHPFFSVTLACDRHQKNRQLALATFPNISTTDKDDDIFNNASIDVVVVATQANYHYALCKKALCHQKHVFVEKPFVLSTKEAAEICELSERYQKKVFVNHIFLYTEGYKALKQIVTDNTLGKIYRISSQRCDFGKFPKDINIAWHLMYHDIYILTDLLNEDPQKVFFKGTGTVIKHLEDGACAIASYESGIQASLFADMYFPEKVRKVMIQCEQGIIIWDEQQENPITLTNHSARLDNQNTIIYHGDGSKKIITTPRFSALMNAIENFYNYLCSSIDVPCHAQAAMRIVKTVQDFSYVQ